MRLKLLYLIGRLEVLRGGDGKIPPHQGYSLGVVTVVSRIFLTPPPPRLAASHIGWSGPHAANKIGEDLYPYNDETGQGGHM